MGGGDGVCGEQGREAGDLSVGLGSGWVTSGTTSSVGGFHGTHKT